MSLLGTPGINRVALYIRVSTEEQAEEGWSVDAQERALREFCKAKGWEIVQVYKDEGKTGTNVNRPGFQAMLRDARDGKFEAIVVHKLDRFSRNLVDVLMTLDDLQKKGVSFVSATEAMLDFTTQIGRFILLVLAFFAQWYVENLSAETTKGKKERFEQGLYNGDLRFGYSKGEDGKPVPNGDAEGVLLAWAWCTQGKTDAEIAALLNAAGYRTYRLIESNKKKATPETDPKLRRPWTKDSVASLLRAGQFYLGNTEYVGEGERKRRTQAQQRGERYTMQRQVKVGTHPAILSQEQYERAMAARKERVNPGRVTTPQVPRTYLLGAGLARCAICGDPLRCTNSQMGEHYLYYRCTADWRGEDCSSKQLQVREQYLIPQLDQMIDQLELPADWREHTRQLLAADDGSERQMRERRLKELGDELRRLSFQHQKDLLSDDEYVQLATPIKAEQAQLEKQGAARMPEHVELAGEQIITIRASWKMATREQKRDMLHIMLRAVYVDTDERVIIGFEPQPEFELLFRQTSMRQVNGRFIPVQRAPDEQA
jgi:DNA invertase Pin-like site-specific DNA recombinase